jgi:hypothetical protein
MPSVPKDPAMTLIGRQDGKQFLFADYFSGLLKLNLAAPDQPFP